MTGNFYRMIFAAHQLRKVVAKIHADRITLKRAGRVDRPRGIMSAMFDFTLQGQKNYSMYHFRLPNSVHALPATPGDIMTEAATVTGR